MKIMKKNVVPLIDYLHNAEYNDDKLDDHQYEYLMAPLNELNDDDGLNEECRKRLFEMDILFSEKNGRQIAYPFSSYDNKVVEWKKDELKKLKNICPICKKEMNSSSGDKLEATIDHDPPLSKRFNDGEYLLNTKGRHVSYNDTSRMVILCRSCNSSKGGEDYDRKKLLTMEV